MKVRKSIMSNKSEEKLNNDAMVENDEFEIDLKELTKFGIPGVPENKVWLFNVEIYNEGLGDYIRYDSS